MSIVRDLIKQLPEGRVVAKPREFAIEELTIVNGISNPPSIEPLFAELKASGDAENIRVLKFDCNWVEKRIEFHFQEVIELLSKYGPFEKLRTLAIKGQDYLEPAYIDDIHVIEKVAPNLQYLDMDIAYGIGFGKPFELRKLEGASLYDIDLMELENLSRCSFPALRNLSLCLAIDSVDKKQGIDQDLDRFFSPSFAPNMETLDVAVFFGEKEPKPLFMEYMMSALLEVGERTNLEFLSIPGIFNEEQKKQLIDNRSCFGKLKNFNIGGGI